MQIQRNFLWGGSDEVRKVAWISWNKVCLPKTLGGLGIRNIELFNLALLGKWRWRMLDDERSVWFELLHKLYGDCGILSTKQFSTWWDVMLLDSSVNYALRWFHDCVKCKIGNGNKLRFWEDPWSCPWPLKDIFVQLYEASVRPKGLVAEFGEWVNESWNWKFVWSRILSDEEQHAEDLLIDTLRPVSLSQNCNDRWIWLMDNSKYKVKTVYKMLLNKNGEEPIADASLSALKKVWKVKARSIFLVHAWRTLLSRIPTRAALAQRGIISWSAGTDCVFCADSLEDVDHLFLNCRITAQVWGRVNIWLGIPNGHCHSVVEHFQQHGSVFNGKKKKGIRHLVWHYAKKGE